MITVDEARNQKQKKNLKKATNPWKLNNTLLTPIKQRNHQEY